MCASTAWGRIGAAAGGSCTCGSMRRPRTSSLWISPAAEPTTVGICRPCSTGVKGDVGQVSADKTYDSGSCYEAILSRSAVPTIPPRRDANFSRAKGPPAFRAERDTVLRRIKDEGRYPWQVSSGATRQTLVENAVSRFKGLIGEKALVARVRAPADGDLGQEPGAEPHGGAWDAGIRMRLRGLSRLHNAGAGLPFVDLELQDNAPHHASLVARKPHAVRSAPALVRSWQGGSTDLGLCRRAHSPPPPRRAGATARLPKRRYGGRTVARLRPDNLDAVSAPGLRRRREPLPALRWRIAGTRRDNRPPCDRRHPCTHRHTGRSRTTAR